MRRPTLKFDGIDGFTDTSFVCPHCGVLQVQDGLKIDLNSVYVQAIQCQSCRDITLIRQMMRSSPGGATPEERVTFFPVTGTRAARSFQYIPADVGQAYEDACFLRPLHIGASGAYARRALELILEHLKYGSKVLAQSIEAAQREADPDRRLRKSLLLRLEYVKEIGNFALHVRRDQELTIIDISPEEVDACLETIEELIETCFEEPERDRERIVELNKKLVSAGKREIAVPKADEALSDRPEPTALEDGRKS